jgi:lipopolysaccharide export system permease protein
LRLLSRYVLRQLAAPFVFAVAALTSVMLLNQIAKRFGQLVGKGLDWSVIGEVFLLSLPFIVAMTLPMAVLLAVLYAFSTLASNNEITAMRASGVSVGQLLRPVFLAAVLLTAADYAFVDQGLPAANLRLKALIFDIGRKRPTLKFSEQVINQISPSSERWLRAGRIGQSNGHLKDVTIYDMSGQQDERQVIYADSGRMGFESNQRDLYLTLWSGSIMQFKGSDPALLQLTYFDVNTIRVRNVGNTLERSDADVTKDDREMTTCEMLTVVRDSLAITTLLQRRRAGLLDKDLRALLGLPPAAAEIPAAPGDSTAGAGPAPWCSWLRRAGAWILPGTAQAQTPAQTPSRRLQPWKRQVIEEGSRAPNASAEPGGLLGPDRPSGGPETGQGRAVPLTAWADVMNTAEGLRTARKSANVYLVEVHKKFAISVACLVFVLVGIPMALRFPRGGMGLVLGGGLGVFALYYISLTAGEPLADQGKVLPAVAMWGPNVVFTVIGLVGLLRVNRELGSTRGGDFAELADLMRRRVARWRRR